MFLRVVNSWLASPRQIRHATSVCHFRGFSTYPRLLGNKALPPRLVIPESDLDESFLKGSGPGGQKINKTSSAVQLKHLPTGVVVKCQETRSRDQNRKLARRILAERLDFMEKGSQSRTAIQQEIKRKKKASATKKSRRKYKKLDGDRDDKEAETDGDDESIPKDQHSMNHAQETGDEQRTGTAQTKE
jgi:protein subunit release factor B